MAFYVFSPKKVSHHAAIDLFCSGKLCIRTTECLCRLSRSRNQHRGGRQQRDRDEEQAEDEQGDQDPPVLVPADDGDADDGADERLEILSDAGGVWRCRTIFNCTDACPRGINITRAILEVSSAIVDRGI